jgi:putative pyruvate formate lyase activating enzyme
MNTTTKSIRVYRSGIHRGEEALIVGNQRAGMITLSGCHLACRSCYTPETSRQHIGVDHDALSFSHLVDALIKQRAGNLNLISPTHLWTQLREPLFQMKRRYDLPLILKISGYEPAAMVRDMAQIADVFVPDFKVSGSLVAEKEHLPKNYADQTAKALSEMLSTHGDSLFTKDGLLYRGIVVRHLIIPGHADDSALVIDRLNQIGFRGHLNLMTRFVDSNAHTLHAADPRLVRSLAETARASGMEILVDGNSNWALSKGA